MLSAVLPFSQLTVTQSLSEGGFVGDKAFNGEGMTGDLHSNDYTKNWLAGNPGGSFSVTDQWLKIDLGGTYALDALRVWNNNHPHLTNLGISQADVYVATSDPGNNVNESNTAFNPAGWTLAIEDQTFSESPGGTSIAQTDPDISLGGVQAAFLAFKIDANHGNELAVGLSEMRILASPVGNTSHTLTVNGGTVNGGAGGGTYSAGESVAIQADAAPTGQFFAGWTGADASLFANVLSENTTFTMPSADAVISASYAPVETGETQTWQIDFNATEPTHFTLQSVVATWDAGFGATWNSYEATMFGVDNGVQRPFHTGDAVNNLLDSVGDATSADFAITDGKMYGMIVGYNNYPSFNSLGGDILGMSSEHLFWGDDLPLAPNLGTTDSISMEFSDLTAGTYSLTVYSASSWHDPHRAMRIEVDGQTQDLNPGANGQSYQYQPNGKNIRTYLDENIGVTFDNLTVDASGVLSIDMFEIGSLDPSLSGLILTRVAGVPVVDSADFDNDGDVDGSDFLAWQRGLGTDAGSGQVAAQSEGNANNDQFVNGDDLNIWNSQYGQTSGLAAASAAEGSTSSLAGLPLFVAAKDEALTEGVTEPSDSLEYNDYFRAPVEALRAHDLGTTLAASFQDFEESDSSASDALFDQLGASILQDQLAEQLAI